MDDAPAEAEGRIRAAIERLLGSCRALGVAVSGGGDSTALMHMLARWKLPQKIHVATVDHGLRPESAAEAQTVASQARELGFPHEVLIWHRNEDDGGNLMANARTARLKLLSDWARRKSLPAVALGHTADDQAETFLMRLTRGAGIDGLSNMAESRQANGVEWLRPMLGATRAQLRIWLEERDISWIDDPSNNSRDFARIRIRQAMAALDLDPQTIATSARNLGDARHALDLYAHQIVSGTVACNGSLLIPLRPLLDAPREIFRRILIAGCRWVTGADYPPRRLTVQNAIEAISAKNRVTLDGVLIEPVCEQLRLIREPEAARRADSTNDPIWDNRWYISGLKPGDYIAALGTATLAGLPWREKNFSRDEAAATPAIWNADELQAVPLLQTCGRYSARPLRNTEDFRTLLLSH